ncbi:rubrerythrin family protein, partial [Alphaproteobacteria bacterium]|nr:rubrerythrin family protein [Alphaproteobacteria bacterium]
LDLYKTKFNDIIPYIKREHVSGFYSRRPLWLTKNLSLSTVRKEIVKMESDAANFYYDATQKANDPDVRKLLGDLAAIESKHGEKATLKLSKIESSEIGDEEIKKDEKQFILTWVQPGLAGLMDGSVSTLAPIFATAFATKDSHTTLLVGLAASIGAGISMGFTEAVHDDGVLSGRGSPVKRGFASGIMTTLGGLGHALPYLIADFYTATVIAMLFVLVELWAIAWIQTKYMKIKFTKAIFQVVFGGSLVLAAGILIGGG